MTMSVGSVLALIGIMSFIIIMKVLICSCYMNHQRRRAEDRRTLLEEDDPAERLYEIHQTRMRARRAREPPPTFEVALRTSRPVSYIDVEEPPPTYEEYVHSSSNSPKDSGLDYSPSVNPSDSIIPLSLHHVNELESTA